MRFIILLWQTALLSITAFWTSRVLYALNLLINYEYYKSANIGIFKLFLKSYEVLFEF